MARAVQLFFDAEDVPTEVRRLVALGASHHRDHEEHGTRWAVMTDPEGNEFCVGALIGTTA